MSCQIHYFVIKAIRLFLIYGLISLFGFVKTTVKLRKSELYVHVVQSCFLSSI